MAVIKDTFFHEKPKASAHSPIASISVCIKDMPLNIQHVSLKKKKELPGIFMVPPRKPGQKKHKSCCTKAKMVGTASGNKLRLQQSLADGKLILLGDPRHLHVKEWLSEYHAKAMRCLQKLARRFPERASPYQSMGRFFQGIVEHLQMSKDPNCFPGRMVLHMPVGKARIPAAFLVEGVYANLDAGDPLQHLLAARVPAMQCLHLLMFPDKLELPDYRMRFEDTTRIGITWYRKDMAEVLLRDLEDNLSWDDFARPLGCAKRDIMRGQIQGMQEWMEDFGDLRICVALQCVQTKLLLGALVLSPRPKAWGKLCAEHSLTWFDKGYRQGPDMHIDDVVQVLLGHNHWMTMLLGGDALQELIGNIPASILDRDFKLLILWLVQKNREYTLDTADEDADRIYMECIERICRTLQKRKAHVVLMGTMSRRSQSPLKMLSGEVLSKILLQHRLLADSEIPEKFHLGQFLV